MCVNFESASMTTVGGGKLASSRRGPENRGRSGHARTSRTCGPVYLLDLGEPALSLAIRPSSTSALLCTCGSRHDGEQIATRTEAQPLPPHSVRALDPLRMRLQVSTCSRNLQLELNNTRHCSHAHAHMLSRPARIHAVNRAHSAVVPLKRTRLRSLAFTRYTLEGL